VKVLGAGGYVNIGIVFSDKHKLLQVFDSLKNYIVQKGSKFIAVKYSKDVEGNAWIESEIDNNLIESTWLKGYYTEFRVSGLFLHSNLKEIDLLVIKENHFFGFLLGISWDEIHLNKQDDIQQHIIDVLVNLYKSTNYDYAFVGHELEIEIGPENFEKGLKQNDYYPVGIVPKGTDVEIYYGVIGIDGLSTQEKKKEITKI
jgi:Immunity protein 64